MKLRLMDDICCPYCRGDLRLTNRMPVEGNWIDSGVIACVGCTEIYPIIEGIPVLISKDKIAKFTHNPRHMNILAGLGLCGSISQDLDTEDEIKINSSLQWGKQRETDTFTEGNSDTFSLRFFLEELQIERADLEGKVILDACCGGGRGVRFSKDLAQAVYAIDISETIYQVAARFSDDARQNLYLIRCDACALPFRADFFDAAYSQRALHHLPNFEEGLAEVTRTVKPAGTVSFSVYSHENNGIMLYLVEPFRHGLSKVGGLAAIRAATLFISLITFPFVKLYTLAMTESGTGFCLHRLLLHWGSMEFFRYKENIVFDLLQAPQARYLSEKELDTYLEKYGLQKLCSYLQHGTVWCMSSRKQRLS